MVRATLRKVFTCGLCGKPYFRKAPAIACEKSHKSGERITQYTDGLESTPDHAYYDRNQVVEVMAIMASKLENNYGIKRVNDEWGIVYVDLPTGQVSYHIPLSNLNAHLPEYQGEWDGHKLDEKRKRMREYIERWNEWQKQYR